MEGSETGGAWVGTGLERWGGKMEGERDGRCMGGDGAGREDGGERDTWVGTGLGREDGGERDGRREDGGERDGRRMGGEDGAGECMGVDACAADMLVTRTWLHHKHHCRLLRVSAQVERSMGVG